MRNGVIAALAACSLLLLGSSGASGATSSSTVPIITTIAGGDGGPGPGPTIAMTPCGVSAGAGSVYATNGGVVWNLNTATDQLSPVAGVGMVSNALARGGVVGNAADGISALQTTVSGCGQAVDGSGNLLFIDESRNRVRVVATHTGSYYGRSMVAGDVYTIAGNGTKGFSGDGGPALKAELSNPVSVAADRAGNVVIADNGNNRIRVVAASSGRFYGKAMVAGDIYTVFTGDTVSYLDEPITDRWGNLVVADTGDSDVYVVAEKTGTFYGQSMTTGGIYPIAQLPGRVPDISTAVTSDASGNVVIASLTTDLVQVVAASTGTFYGQGMTAGQVYTVAGGGSSTGEGVPATQAAMWPLGVAVDGSGNLVIADVGRWRVRVVATKSGTFYGLAMTAGDIYTVAGTGDPTFSGDGGPATAAPAFTARDTAVDGAGNVLIADSSDNRVRVLAGSTGLFYGQSMTKGDFYTIAGGGGQIPDGVPAVQANLGASGLSIDSAGNILITDGQLLVVAERNGLFYGRHMAVGYVYTITNADGYSAVSDHNGNVVFTEYKDGDGFGHVNVFAVKSGTFYGMAMKADQVYTIAGWTSRFGGPLGNGGPALAAYILGTTDTVVDAAGNLVLTDEGANMVRVIAATTGTFYGQAMKAGYIYQVAGSGTAGLGGNGGPAVKAELKAPQGVAVDGAGNLVVADSGNNEIRVVAEKTGTYYSQAMKAGYIYAIAGRNIPAFWGDGGPAASAWLDYPLAVSVRPGGGTLVSDDGRVRLIAR